MRVSSPPLCREPDNGTFVGRKLPFVAWQTEGIDMLNRIYAVALAVTIALVPTVTLAEGPEASTAEGKVELDAEYRVQSIFIDPLELNGLTAGRVNYTEQRFRLETAFKPVEEVRILTQFDFLDGVLFGDNGYYGREGAPQPGSGMALTSRWPNAATWDVGLVDVDRPLDPDSYGLVLTDAEPVKLNRVYGEVVLPFGLLRVGRQPSSTGPGINTHDGSAANRWGVSKYSASADRILFATKISEAFKMMSAGNGYTPDRSMDDGVFIGGAYDVVVEDDIGLGADDLSQGVGLIQWKAKEPNWFGWEWESFLLQVVVGGRFGDEFDTDVIAVPVTVEFEVGAVHFLGEVVALSGSTTEISEGLAALQEPDEKKRVIHNQKIEALGARAIVDVELGPITGTLEFDYASGDADPRDETPLTTYNFARDANVGLLLFEHVLAFESARSAHVGIKNLENAGLNSFPLADLASDGRFHNGKVFFPQVLYNPTDELGIRFGSMFAWAAEPVTDPIMTALNEDGVEIEDDAVNWHGGKPGSYYGTELDLQVEWKYRNYFVWTVEGAVLFPGDALEDESGDAVNSFLVQNRFTFMF